MDELRIGVVGIGHLGNYHLRKYALIPNCRIVAVADIVAERAQRAAAQYGCLAFKDHRELLGRVDAVSIATPTSAHYETALTFLEAGVSTLVEKPITTTLPEADALIAAAERNRAVLQVGFIERFNPAIVALAGTIQRPLFIEAHRLHPFFERGLDVDVILDLMIHDLDIILHFVKSPVAAIDAVGVSVLSDQVDIANVRLKFASGCVANITASRVTGKTMQKIRFFGVDGYHAVDFSKRDLVSLGRRTSDAGKVEIFNNAVEVMMHDPLEAEIRAFVASVRDGVAPPVTGRDGRDALALALNISREMKKAQDELLLSLQGEDRE
ncbi:MAG: Gfo/Idh/MocA family oxidoreductase [Pseudomonadota bacterium]|nr:Gfo/Idh/MocA family oxidoreductase [Pseudomonadota bacterium]